jgi:hypothetical protein
MNLGYPLSSGYSPQEVAVQLGESPAWVTGQLELLQDELRRLSG